MACPASLCRLHPGIPNTPLRWAVRDRVRFGARTASRIRCDQLGREVGRGVTELGFTAMTGGGPGLMEAVNRGAREAGGRSVGCNIELPNEQLPNPYLDHSITCRYFFVRRLFLFSNSYAFIGLPGGLGTLDELFEALTLIQTGKIAHFPIVLIGTEYWHPLQDLASTSGSSAYDR